MYRPVRIPRSFPPAFYEKITDFIRDLATTREGDGTMLDNTAVVITNVMGGNHYCTGLPTVIVGGCGGYFRTGGRYLKYGDWQRQRVFHWDIKGVPHNGLLVALGNAMDVPMEYFGDPKYGGELPGLRA